DQLSGVRVQAVGAHHEVEPLRGSSFEPDGDALVVLVDGEDRVVEAVFDAVGPGADQLDEVCGEQLDVVGVEPAGGEGRLFGAPQLVTFSIQHGHAEHGGAPFAGGVFEAHAPQHGQCRAADIDGLAARTRAGST